MEFDYRTRGNSSPNGKPRIFFACHPEDFNNTFQNIVDEILSIRDCSIWFLKDTNDIDDYTLKNDLSTMKGVIIPVTMKLLTHDSYVSTNILPLAFTIPIPVCPLIYEDTLSTFIYQDGALKDGYKKLFRDCQYLNKFNKDVTAIPYGEKFSNFLQSVLTDNELIEKIKSAFDALIFLSYRKKDRIYAQQLMHLIHNNEFCRKIAIWYDEFLVPGEDFNQAIVEALDKSDLFALVVTPNLVNEVNYVMTKEYPFAYNAKKTILPVEMVETDNNDLKHKFNNIPNQIKHTDSEALTNTLKSVFPETSNKDNDTPERSFFIGLAYLDGVYVEVNNELGLSMIESAANEDLPEAIEKLSSVYRYGIGLNTDFEKALSWQNRLINHYAKDTKSEESKQRYCLALWNLASLYQDNNRDIDAVKIYEKLYQVYCVECDGILDGRELTVKKITVLYTIAKIYAKNRDIESQNKAYSCYEDIIKLIIELRYNVLNDDILEQIAKTLDEIGVFVAKIPGRDKEKINFEGLLLSARKIRRMVEERFKIDFESVCNDRVFNYSFNDMSLPTDFIVPDSLTIYDQNITAEELLFLSLAICDYLMRKDIQQYYDCYANTFSHIADLWTSCGYSDKALETYKLNYETIKKYSSAFYIKVDDKIADMALQLGKAYLNCDNIELARSYIKEAITLFKTLAENDIVSKIKLAEAYRQLALASVQTADNFYNLEKTIGILENIVDSEFSTTQLNMELTDCYCTVMESCVIPEFWDSKRFFDYYDKALKICKKYYNQRKAECSAYLSKIYCLQIFMENCKSMESINRVSRLFDVSLNNCNMLFSEDSEAYYPCLIQVLDRFSSFQNYAMKMLESDILEAWEINIAKIIIKNLSNIIEQTTKNPKRLLPYEYRTDFTDYLLLNGSVDSHFIHNFKSSLFMFWDLVISCVYKKGLIANEINLKEEITETYDTMIKQLRQGYALQVFLREKDELLNLVEC